MASATAAELEIFAGKLAECLRSAAAAAASIGAGGDVAGGSDTDSLQLEALRLQADAVHAKRLFDNLPSRDQDASLQRRIEDVSDGIHELAARCHPDSEWEISDDDGSTPPAQPTQPPQPAQPGVPPPQQAPPAQQSTPQQRRRELGLSAPPPKQKSANAEEARQERERQRQEGLRQMSSIAQRLKAGARDLGDAVGEGDGVIGQNAEAVAAASGTVNKQLAQVHRTTGWGSWGLGSNSWLGGKMSMVMALMTSTVMLALLAVALALVYLVVLQVIIAFPSVVYLYHDGTPVNPGLIRRFFYLVAGLLQQLYAATLALYAAYTVEAW